MSPTFLLRARWQIGCSTSTSVMVSSGQPAADMQRTAQRENAFHATIRPNSSSESSTLFADTRCDDETMPLGVLGLRGRVRCGKGATFVDIAGFPRIVENLLTIYRGPS